MYQPLLGWKSERTLKRFRRGHALDRRRLISLLRSRYRGIYKLTGVEGHVREIKYIHPGEQPGAVKGFGSFLLQAIAAELPAISRMASFDCSQHEHVVPASRPASDSVGFSTFERMVYRYLSNQAAVKSHLFEASVVVSGAGI